MSSDSNVEGTLGMRAVLRLRLMKAQWLTHGGELVTGFLSRYVIACRCILFNLQQGLSRFYSCVCIFCSFFFEPERCCVRKRRRRHYCCLGLVKDDAQKMRDRRDKNNLPVVSSFSFRAFNAVLSGWVCRWIRAAYGLWLRRIWPWVGSEQ